MKLDKKDYVVTRHPDGSPAIYRRSRVNDEKYIKGGYKEITYNNGMKFVVDVNERFL